MKRDPGAGVVTGDLVLQVWLEARLMTLSSHGILREILWPEKGYFSSDHDCDDDGDSN
jgi:hypothetical protein